MLFSAFMVVFCISATSLQAQNTPNERERTDAPRLRDEPPTWKPDHIDYPGYPDPIVIERCCVSFFNAPAQWAKKYELDPGNVPDNIRIEWTWTGEAIDKKAPGIYLLTAKYYDIYHETAPTPASWTNSVVFEVADVEVYIECDPLPVHDAPTSGVEVEAEWGPIKRAGDYNERTKTVKTTRWKKDWILISRDYSPCGSTVSIHRGKHNANKGERYITPAELQQITENSGLARQSDDLGVTPIGCGPTPCKTQLMVTYQGVLDVDVSVKKETYRYHATDTLCEQAGKLIKTINISHEEGRANTTTFHARCCRISGPVDPSVPLPD